MNRICHNFICRRSSLHAIEVLWLYLSGNKPKNYENKNTNDFLLNTSACLCLTHKTYS
eukprot:UN05138